MIIFSQRQKCVKNIKLGDTLRFGAYCDGYCLRFRNASKANKEIIADIVSIINFGSEVEFLIGTNQDDTEMWKICSQTRYINSLPEYEKIYKYGWRMCEADLISFTIGRIKKVG